MSKNILIFDTETSGFKENRLLQLAYQVYSPERELLKEYKAYIKPVDFEIQQGAQDVHGISRGKAMDEGILVEDAIMNLMPDLADTSVLVAHNIKFDQRVVFGEIDRIKRSQIADPEVPKDLNGMVISDFYDLIRKGAKNNPKSVCTMKSLANFCAIPHPTWNSYKWPKLIELYKILFDEEFDGAHDALIDVKACARCYFEAIDRGIL